MPTHTPPSDRVQTHFQAGLWLEWLQRASKELKIEQPESFIRTDSDGIARAPYYTQDGPFVYTTPLVPYPGNPDVLEGGSGNEPAPQSAQSPAIDTPSWLAVAPVTGKLPSEWNKRALHALQHGGESILFEWPNLTPVQIADSLHGILPQYAPLFVRGVDARVLHEGFAQWMRLGDIHPHHIQGALLHDATDLLQMNEQELESQFRPFSADLLNFNPVGADTAGWRAKGLSAPQEMALGWLCLYRLLSIQAELNSSAFAPHTPNLVIDLSVGCSTEFFDELARLRALRAGIHRVASLFQPKNTSGIAARMVPRILVRIPSEYLPGMDPHTNLLRLTTMGISAVLGGCSALSLPRFDPKEGAGDDSFSDELSLQLQMVLRHEAFPNLPIDAGAGSGYIEHLSQSHGACAWSIFGEMVTHCTQGDVWDASAINNLLYDWCRKGKELERQKRDSGLRIRVGVDRYKIDDTHDFNSSAS